MIGLMLSIAVAAATADSSQATLNQLFIWDACVMAYAERYAAQQEPAEIVADAAITQCRTRERPFADAAAKMFRDKAQSTPTQAEAEALQYQKERREALRRKAVATVLEARAKATR
jgi:hypothetical protein